MRPTGAALHFIDVMELFKAPHIAAANGAMSCLRAPAPGKPGAPRVFNR